jgi:hypothetical protein
LESASLTRSAPGTSLNIGRRLLALPWPAIALGGLIVAVIVGFFVFPIYPNYDSYYSLLWGRELLHLHLPSFDAYRAATEHPLAIGFGAVMSLFGRGGDRIMVACTLASFVVLAMGVYRLGKNTFTPLVGMIAAYIDVPYLAMVIWAATLEVERPRRGGIVWLLLFGACLMRPEAWLITGAYWLWCFPNTSWRRRAVTLGYTFAGTIIWVALDTAVTGHPLFSLQHTNGLAEELGRARDFASVPRATIAFLRSLDKLPVVLGAVFGLMLAIWIAPKRSIMPVTLLVIGIGTFFAVGLAGLSIIDRYLLIPSLMLMILAAVALGGWTMLRPGALVRRLWMVGAVALVVFGFVFTVNRVNLAAFTNNLFYRGDSHRALAQLLDTPQVRAAEKCGPLSVANHKHVPDTRWLADAGANRVIARSQVVQITPDGTVIIDHAAERRLQRGVALYENDRAGLIQDQLIALTQPPRLTSGQLLPLPGFHRIAANKYFAAYVRC